jgi:hypothetical protein
LCEKETEMATLPSDFLTAQNGRTYMIFLMRNEKTWPDFLAHKERAMTIQMSCKFIDFFLFSRKRDNETRIKRTKKKYHQRGPKKPVRNSERLLGWTKRNVM